MNTKFISIRHSLLACRFTVTCLLLGFSVSVRAAIQVPTRETQVLVTSKDLASEICGAYVMWGELTSNHTLHLFPDGDAFIKEVSGFGSSLLVATGKWTIDKDVLRLSFDSKVKLEPVIQGLLPSMSNEYNLFQGMSERGMPRFLLLAVGRYPKSGDIYPIRVVSYSDWPSTKAQLLSSRATIESKNLEPRHR